MLKSKEAIQFVRYKILNNDANDVDYSIQQYLLLWNKPSSKKEK